ncbi:hypothetical protein [Lysinibacillus sp. fls2-241-R2A-57]|uniref:hypothetical protein n=1 Tax=Lysinibacillus sp. fls2-241-R2A-57 TaxID=3040292 RepID=UPI002555B5F5|nr:hypothetical protein [Lysinibacillus sp. fls2-241-R2A-57]
MFSVRKRSVNVAAANVLSVRKRSDSNNCFICAKAKRQRQMFSVAKAKRQLQMFYLRESEASAANVFCSESKASATKPPVGTEINPRNVIILLYAFNAP